MRWSLRPPTVDDVDAIVAINVRAWRHAYADLMPAEVLAGLEPGARAARLRERLRTGSSTEGLVAVDDDGEVAGYCWFGDYRPDDDVASPDGPGWAEVYAMYVDPRRHRAGAGSALMTAALAALAPRPVALWVLEGNTPARGFYERHGFRPDGAAASFGVGGLAVPEVRYVLTR